MKTILTVLTAVSAIALGSAAYAADPQNTTEYSAKDNGGYAVKSTSKSTDAAGTEKTGQRKVDVSVKKNGAKKKTVTTKSSTDPKGLMNSKDNEAKSSTEVKADGSAEAVKSESHEDAAGTNVSTEAKTDVDANGNVVTETKKTVDPKGLMNSKTIKSKTVNGQPAAE